MDHVKPVSEFGRKMGENVTLKRVASVTEPTSVDLLEGVRIPEDTLTLWGQNLVAYGLRETCSRAAGPGTTACKAKALDVTGTVAVPEPATLLMLALGLGAVAWTVRRQGAAARL